MEFLRVTTDANGFAVFMLNGTRDTMQIVISTAMAGEIQKLRIYKGAPGTNGSMVLNLDAKIEGNVARTVIFGSTLQGMMLDFYERRPVCERAYGLTSQWTYPWPG